MSKEIVFLAPPTFGGMTGKNNEMSVFRKMLDTMTFGGTNKLEHVADRTFGHRRTATALEVFREYSETTIAGGLLGYLHGRGSLEPFGIPLDGGLAILGGLGRVIAGADSGIGKTAGDLGIAGNTIWWFRMGERYGKAHRKSKIHGDDYAPPDAGDNVDIGSDPVVESAKNLG